MRDKVISLLEALGVTVPDTDPLIDFIINSVTERIKMKPIRPQSLKAWNSWPWKWLWANT